MKDRQVELLAAIVMLQFAAGAAFEQYVPHALAILSVVAATPLIIAALHIAFPKEKEKEVTDDNSH